ncbi:MAG: hypothetical protein WCO05_02415 [Candidatus Moraniibacteriota bacterium]
MKRGLLLISVVIFFALLVVVGEVSCDEFKKINNIKKELLANLQSITLAIGSDELNRINDFAKRNALMGISQKFGAMVLEDGKCSSGIIFAPILDIQDYNLGEEWEGFCLSGMAMQFFPHSRILAINERIKFSSKASGLAFAREAYKAYMSAPEKRNDNQIEYELLEKDAQAFQNKLMLFLGGERYRKLVYAQAKKISKEMMEADSNILRFPCVYDKRLSVISGKQPLMPEEERFWMSSFWLHAVFIAIENTSDSNVDEQKKQFLAVVMRAR